MRVVLAEDLFLLRDGLVRLLEAHDFEIAAAVESGPELARALAELEPDVARSTSDCRRRTPTRVCSAH